MKVLIDSNVVLTEYTDMTDEEYAALDEEMVQKEIAGSVCEPTRILEKHVKVFIIN